jgi:hypothetical protein
MDLSFGEIEQAMKEYLIIQNKIVRIVASVMRSCRKPFKKFHILPLVSGFILSLLSVIVDSMEKF